MNEVTLRLRESNLAKGHRMIETIEIENFKCYRRVRLPDCRRLNIITGDNGGGKTTLLEALFLALGYNAELLFRIKTFRGVPIVNGQVAAETEGLLWNEMFHGFDTSKYIQVITKGNAAETRTFRAGRSVTDENLPEIQVSQSQPISLLWRDSNGSTTVSMPTFQFDGGISYSPTFQTIPLDCTFLAAQIPVSNPEVANRFSQLSIRGEAGKIERLLAEAFPRIKDLSNETVGGVPMLYADVGLGSKIPIASVSSGMNRLVSALTAALRPNSVLLIDEVETGIYYDHMVSTWQLLLAAVKDSNSQIFATTHSNECLKALVEASADDLEEVALWRTVQSASGVGLDRLSGQQIEAALSRDIEIR